MNRKIGWMLALGTVATVSMTTAKAVPFELDDWSTPFSPNPITCSAAACTSATEHQMGIGPSGEVDRKGTLKQENAGTGPVPGTDVGAYAATRDSGATVNTANGNYLVFQTGEDVYGSLDLLYGFERRLINEVWLNVANLSDFDFNVAIFTLNKDATEFEFQTAYLVVAGHVHEEILKFEERVSTDELLIIYNPLAGMSSSWSFRANDVIPWTWDEFDPAKKASEIHVELCCVVSVPEPGSLALLGLGLAGLGIVTRRRRRS